VVLGHETTEVGIVSLEDSIREVEAVERQNRARYDAFRDAPSGTFLVQVRQPSAGELYIYGGALKQCQQGDEGTFPVPPCVVVGWQP
jgi:hypothetical protein